MTDTLKTEIVALIPRLRRFAMALAGSQDEGDDVVQAACLKALGNLHQYEPGTRLDSWMFRIVQTTFLDQRRRYEHRMTSADLDTVYQTSDDGYAQRKTEHGLLLQQVRDAMGDLPDDQRAALALVAIEGFSYKEAAAILEVPVGTVMSRLARARDRLRPLGREALS
ncbi:MAG: RNA polymerase sigma factor [Pseudomonadota bacterium]